MTDKRSESRAQEEESSGPDISYSAADLQANAAAFGTTPDGMAGALHLAGLDEATRDQARAAVEAYLSREVG